MNRSKVAIDENYVLFIGTKSQLQSLNVDEFIPIFDGP